MASPGENRQAVLGWHADDVLERAERTPDFPVLASARKVIRSAEDSGSPSQHDHITDSQQVWRTRAVPIYRDDSLYCTQLEFHDITNKHRERLENEECLYAAETFRILFETVEDYAIVMLDLKGNIATWNAGAQRLKGYTKAETVGHHFSIFYDKDDLAVDKPGRELQDALRDGRCEDEGWRFRKDGSKFWANVVITPVVKDGTLLGFTKVTRDLTDRRNAEQRLVSAYEDVSKMKSGFLANMSHEIRTPLQGLLEASSLLLRTQLGHDQLGLAHIIQETGEVLLRVIDDILDYSKIVNGSFSISHDIINIADIVHSVESAQQRTFNYEVTFRTHLDPQIPKVGKGDGLRYRQIVQNLVSNAAKFTEKGHVHLNITLESEDQEYSIIKTEVVDTGIGVPAASTKALFTPFTKLDNSATKRHRGTGLGLSICKSLTELMGGQIGYQANPEGQGSVFWFTIKLEKCNQVHTVDTPATEIETPRLSPRLVLIQKEKEKIQRIAPGKRLLLAEDNMVNQKIMLRTLAKLGFTNIDIAVDGKEAVAKTVQASVPYDLILIDISMPIQDGVSATEELRSRGFQMPIIGMTANRLQSHMEMVAKAMTECLVAPIRMNGLIEALLRCLQTSSDESKTDS